MFLQIARIVLLLVLCSQTYAAQLNPSQALSSQHSTSKHVEKTRSLENKIKLLEIIQKTQQKEIDAGTKLLNKKVDQYIFFRDWEYKLVILGAGLTIGFVAGGWRMGQKIDDLIDKQTESVELRLQTRFEEEQKKSLQCMADRFMEEEETLRKTFAHTRIEESFKESSHILVVSGKTDSGLDKDFERFGFIASNLKRSSFETVFDRTEGKVRIDENKYDLIVLDNIEQDDMIAYVDAGTLAAYLIFYPGHYSQYPDRQRTNIANNKLTLYSRAIEVLLYKHTHKLT